MPSTFTAAERERIRYHLGYMNTTQAASISLGIVRPVQTMWLVESAMDLITLEGEPRVRKLINQLECIEEQMFCATPKLAVVKTGDTELRQDEIDALEREYKRWAQRLADQLGVPLYYWSSKFKNNAGPGISNIPVTR